MEEIGAGLTPGVTAAVLVAALLHAGWNAMIRSSGDKTLDTLLVAGGAAAISAAVLPFVPVPDRASWPHLATSGLLHVAYFSALIGAYRFGDLSRAYTLMRGVAPLLIALAGAVVLGERLPVAVWAGVGLVSAGVLAIGVLRTGLPGEARSTWFALANAGVICCYTLVDGAGVRLSGSTAGYTLWVFLLSVVPLLAWVSRTRGRALLSYTASAWMRGLVGGGCQVGAYGIALWAMTLAPVAAVAALRETSVVFAAIIGALFLKERFGAGRIAAAVVVATGVALMK